jgi:hypothetical protein
MISVPVAIFHARYCIRKGKHRRTGKPLPQKQPTNPRARINCRAGFIVVARQARAYRRRLQPRLGVPGVYKRSLWQKLLLCRSFTSPLLRVASLRNTDNGEHEIPVHPWRAYHHDRPIRSESWIWKAFED